MSITISYTLTEPEYFEYSYYTMWKAPWNKQKRKRYYFTTIIVGIALTVLVALTYSIKSLESFIFFALVFLIIYCTLIIVLTKDRFRRMANKAYNDPNNKNMFSKSELSFNEAGIMAKDEFSESISKWSVIIKRHSTENIYILYPSNLAGIVIPKRVLKSETEKEAFEKMLSQYIPLQADLL